MIKTALTSFGMSGVVFHAPFLHLNPGFELYAVYERSKKLAAEKYPSIKSVDTLEELLEDEAIELIIVNSPNYTHYEYAKKALLAGKHVLVEKPFAITVREADELVALADKQGKKLSVYQNRRWDSDFKTVKKVVEEKLLGNLVEAEFHFDRYKEEISPKAHKEVPGPGAGILYDLGPHLIDQAIHLFGKPEAVFADIVTIRRISAVEDYFEIILYYDRMRVRLKAGYQVREALPSFILHGSKGSFIKTRADTQETRLQLPETPDAANWGIEPETEQGLLHTEINGEVVRKLITSETGNYMEFYDLLFRAIRFDEPLPVTAKEARNVILVIEKAYQSLWEKRLVAFA